MQKLNDYYSEDQITGAIVAVIIITALVAVFVVLLRKGWSGGAAPVINSVRPEAAKLAINIMSWAFAAAGFVVGTRKISNIRNTACVYGLVFAAAIIICCTNNWLIGESNDCNFWEVMDLQQTIGFIAPVVAAYLLGAAIRFLLRGNDLYR